jgi:hypothetical protein
MTWGQISKNAVRAFLIAAYISASAPALSACPIVDSSFSGDRGAFATFRSVGRRPGWPSDIALGVRAGRGMPMHWFLFDRGSARYINLISTGDVSKKGWTPPSSDGGYRPLGEMHFVSATKTLVVSERIPTSQDAAPTYLLLPDLPEVLTRRATPPEDIHLFFFRLRHCGQKSRYYGDSY